MSALDELINTCRLNLATAQQAALPKKRSRKRAPEADSIVTVIRHLQPVLVPLRTLFIQLRGKGAVVFTDERGSMLLIVPDGPEVFAIAGFEQGTVTSTAERCATQTTTFFPMRLIFIERTQRMATFFTGGLAVVQFEELRDALVVTGFAEPGTWCPTG